MSDLIQMLEARASQAATPEERVDALNALANELRRADVRRAMDLSQQAYDLASDPTRPYLKGRADSLYSLSRGSFFTGQNEQALAKGSEALSLYRQIDDRAGQMTALGHLGAIYLDLGEHSAALDYQLQSLSLAEQIGDRRGQGNVALNIGFIYSETGRCAEAFPYYDQALALCREQADLRGEARILNSCCVDYTRIGEYDRALEYGSRSFQLFEITGDIYGQGVVLSSLGETYVAAGRYDEALAALLRGLALLKTRNDRLGSYEAIYTLYQIGVAYLQLHDLDHALPPLQQALASARGAQIKILEYQCHEALAELFEQRQDLRQALEHYRQFHTLKEFVFNEASDRKLQNLEVLHRTRQAEAEAERQKQLREEDRHYFEQISQLQRDFVSAATHDLKNPLNGLVLAIELLELRTPADDQHKRTILQSMRHGISRMNNLIADILDLAKLETGRALDIAPVTVASLVDAALHDNQPAADQKQLAFELRSSLDDVVVECDAAQLRRALDNLVDNAIKYTPNGGRIDLVAERTATDVIIKVADTGPGISLHDTPHLFERFYRVRDAAHQKIEGSGLGLAIVKAIVEQHGGSVWVESELGRGSIFSMSMPLHRAQR
jgi:signal transduction histidine kinase